MILFKFIHSMLVVILAYVLFLLFGAAMLAVLLLGCTVYCVWVALRWVGRNLTRSRWRGLGL